MSKRRWPERDKAAAPREPAQPEQRQEPEQPQPPPAPPEDVLLAALGDLPADKRERVIRLRELNAQAEARAIAAKNAAQQLEQDVSAVSDKWNAAVEDFNQSARTHRSLVVALIEAEKAFVTEQLEN